MSGRVIDERAIGERYLAFRSPPDERGPSRPNGITSSAPPFGCRSVSTRKLPNIRAPLRIDLSDPVWCPEMHDGSGPGELLTVFCANVIHIAPWHVAEGLFAGAGRYLRSDGRLFLYGPFKRGGKHTAVSNAVFDASLREGNPEWGVRDIEAVERLAASAGLLLEEISEMPANNLTLVFGRSKTG